MATSESGHGVGRTASWRLSLAALGVVFGDIGTSPLYALRACFADVGGVAIDTANVLGVLSLIFWSLALVVSVKYVGLVLRADHYGEGGVLALTTLVLSDAPRSHAALLGTLGLIGCALFYGDGALTPAISVLSAVEGLHVAMPALRDFVVPLSLAALVWLFRLQRHGTGAIGGLFGPVIVVWFLTLGTVGLVAVVAQPGVLAAVNPGYAFGFIAHHAAVATGVLGAVFLAVTGGEALYADLGHFGRVPISRAWFLLAWPCLLLNYFGQGALLLAEPAAIENPFYLLAPGWLRVPLVMLATSASIIASQAVISGVFSITQQCQQLGYLPRLKVEHSSAESMGQIYVPVVNWLLCAATIGLVVAFGSSSSLANAYGIAVSGTMTIVTVLMLVLLLGRRSRVARLQACLLAALGIVDAGFLAANLSKVTHGGWFPLLFGALILLLMRTWYAGRASIAAQVAREERSIVSLVNHLQHHPPARVPGCAVFLSRSADSVPRTLLRNLRHNGALHACTILMTIVTEPIPRVAPGRNLEVQRLAPGVQRVVARLGFMEQPDVPRLLKAAERRGLGPLPEPLTYFLGREVIVIGLARGMAAWRKHLFILMSRNARNAGAHLGLMPERVVEIGGQVRI